MNMNSDVITQFEKAVAGFFGSPYAVAVDCCTHGIELCLRHTYATTMWSPTRTYVSIPMLAKKLDIDLIWTYDEWEDYYYLTDNIIDAAVLWKQDSYIPRTFMNLSFQFQKHLNLGRGGMILTDNKNSVEQLKKMSHDGRLPDISWREQDIDMMGYHYYMTFETAKLGLDKISDAINTPPKRWTIDEWPDLTTMTFFQNTK